MNNLFSLLGSPQRIVAPMVDHSELAYRMLCRKYGSQLVYTQMFHARMFLESEEYRRNNFQTIQYDRPLIIQFCGYYPLFSLSIPSLTSFFFFFLKSSNRFFLPSFLSFVFFF